MSEASDKVSGLEQIPLFPLPLVLLPNELLPLHIFEPRYQQMLVDAQQTRNLFGVSLLDPEKAFSDKPAVGSIGCVAEVREIQPLPDGRSNVLTFGIIRYRLLEYVDTDTPYLTAAVDFFEDDEEPQSALQPISDEVYTLFERVAKAAFDLSGNRGRFPQIERVDPEPFSFLVAAALSLDNDMKYSVAEMVSTSERLKRLRELLVLVAGKMESQAQMQKLAQKNGHSNEKIDLP